MELIAELLPILGECYIKLSHNLDLYGGIGLRTLHVEFGIFGY